MNAATPSSRMVLNDINLRTVTVRIHGGGLANQGSTRLKSNEGFGFKVSV